MDTAGFGRPDRQQYPRSLPSVSQWTTSRPLEIPMGYYSQWNEPDLLGETSVDTRSQHLQTSNDSFSSGFHETQPSTTRFLLQQPISGPSYQSTFDLHNNTTRPFQHDDPIIIPDGAAYVEKPKRRIYSQSEWNRHLPRIKELYMEQDLTLRNTMAIMASEQEFHPSERAYKAKIDEQGWRKNLPLSIAHFIVQKQLNRKDVPTDFILYDNPISLQRAEETVRRSKTGRSSLHDTETLITPNGLTYRTPLGYKRKTSTPNLCSPPTRKPWTPFEDSTQPRSENHIALVWQGLRISDLTALAQEAQAIERSGNLELAEEKYREALSGHEHLLSPTHKDTLQLGYELAGLYASRSNMLLADEVLDRMNQKIVEQWGLSHPKTSAHFFRICDLYRTWSRHEDAKILMNRLSEASIQSMRKNSSASALKGPRVPPIQKLPEVFTGQNAASRDITTTDEADISQRLTLVAAQLVETPSIVSPSKITVSILDLIEQCKQDVPRLRMQLLQACSLLVEATAILEGEEKNTLQNKATELCLIALQGETVIGEQVLKAAIKVADRLVEAQDGGNSSNVEHILERVSAVSEQDVQSDDARNITVLLRVACMYGSHNNQGQAMLWLEHAVSITISVYGCSHAITKVLQAALDDEKIEDYDIMAHRLHSSQLCLFFGT